MTTTAKRPSAVASLARGATVAQAARDSGVSERTLNRWRQEPDFNAEVRTVRTQILGTAVGQLATGASEAVLVLRGCLRDPDSRNRIQAAKVLLESCLNLRESLDLEERLAALETSTEQGR